MTEPSQPPLKARMSLAARLRAYFLAGVLVTAPFALTAYLVWWMVDVVDSRVMPLIPDRYNPNAYLPVGIPGIGVVVALVLVTAIGALTAGLAGRLLVGFSETVLQRMPVVRSLYGAIKQIVSTIVSKQSTSFRECVLVQWPYAGMWTIGFVTGTPTDEIQALSPGRDIVGVYVPTTPNPTGGYLVWVERSALVPMAISVEEGFKFVVSCGIVVPDGATAVPPRNGLHEVAGLRQ
ncbi:MAG: DUF502 domain-containing protein [Proteobacteria bacterium]|nr:DUF502 domain-containing protein [Pseudomonadota bacterium]